MILSLVMFSGASQFAFVGVAAAGSPWAAIPAALLLGVRNAFYGVPVSEILSPRGWRRLVTAHFVIDETTAMAVGQAEPRAKRYAFWSTGLILFTLWQTGSLVGALLGAAIDPARFGLDAAAPAVFLALLWSQLRSRSAKVVAVLGGLRGLPADPGRTRRRAGDRRRRGGRRGRAGSSARVREAPRDRARGGAGDRLGGVATCSSWPGCRYPSRCSPTRPCSGSPASCPVAMLTALVVVGLADGDGDGRWSFDWPVLAGFGAAVIALLLRAGVLVVFVVAVAVTALLRLLV